MRKAIVLAAVAVFAVALATPAKATTLASGKLYNISVNDRSNIFSDQDDTIVGDNETPEAALSSVDIGDENRAIFQIDAANFGVAAPDNHGVLFINDEGGPAVPAIVNNDLQGMLYDLDFIGGSVNGVPVASLGGGGFAPNSTNRFFFGAGTRYGSGGGLNGTWTDLFGVDVTTLGLPYGGILIVYDDSTPEPWPGPGPASWSEGTGAANAAMTATDFYPGISDQTPFLIAVLVELPAVKLAAFGAPAGTLLAEVNATDGFGAPDTTGGLAFANVIGGTAAGRFQEGLFGPGLDLRIEFDPDFIPQNGWQTGSDDPIQFGTIPEPASLTLLGLSLVGLAGAKLRKKQ